MIRALASIKPDLRITENIFPSLAFLLKIFLLLSLLAVDIAT